MPILALSLKYGKRYRFKGAIGAFDIVTFLVQTQLKNCSKGLGLYPKSRSNYYPVHGSEQALITIKKGDQIAKHQRGGQKCDQSSCLVRESFV